MATKSSRSAQGNNDAKRDNKDENYGPRMSRRQGGDGTKGLDRLPASASAMKGPEANLPAGAAALKASTLPVPGINDKLINTHETWDAKRDRQLAKESK